MSKSKLDLLLEEVGQMMFSENVKVGAAYQAYMEERRTMPQPGQEIEVTDLEHEPWVKRKFVAMCPTGRFIAYNEEVEISSSWAKMRIPTPKKKWKVVKTASGILELYPDEQYTQDLPIITTFEA